METVIGFVAGYLVGTREGKAGLERLKTSLNAIKDSHEVRRLATDGITLAEQMIKRTQGGVGGTIARALAGRASRR
jgi:hypothetical protein